MGYLQPLSIRGHRFLDHRAAHFQLTEPAITAYATTWQAAGMVLEVALINVVPGQEDAFAKAYGDARDTLATTPGCRSVRMTKGIESPSRFVLMVEWDSVDAHIENFRATERFSIWRGLIGPYFDGAPTVEHFVDIDAVRGADADQPAI